MGQSRLRILYLEDDPGLAELVLLGLEDYSDLEVMHCQSGPEAIDRAAGFNPQLCLFDVMLPEMDGPTTYGKVRKAIGNGALPVIFMTAKAQQHEVQHYMSLGALGVIRKPFNPLLLGDEIKQLWKGKQ